MTTRPKSFSESYPAVEASVPRARRPVADYVVASAADSDAHQLDSIRLAVSEAVTNAVMHAYRGSMGLIHVSATALPDEIWVLVSDDGCGFQTPPAQPGLGWGLALIADAADDFTIAERGAGGTEVRMRFAV